MRNISPSNFYNKKCFSPKRKATSHTSSLFTITYYFQKILNADAFRIFWQGREDSNPRPTVLETGTLPTELHPCIQRLTLYHIPSHFAIPFLKIFLFFYFSLSLYIFLFLYNCSPSLKAPLSEQKTQKLLCASAFFMCLKAYLCILPEPSPFASFSTSATLTIL